MDDFSIRPEFVDLIVWSSRGSCGNPGCADPECCCALCRKPIGVDEKDLRWDDHSEFCAGCELCEDEVPLTLFRGDGKQTEQARFHSKCFNKILLVTTRPRVVVH